MPELLALIISAMSLGTVVVAILINTRTLRKLDQITAERDRLSAELQRLTDRDARGQYVKAE